MNKNESDFDPEIESFSKDTKIDLDNKIRELHDLGVRLKKNFEEYQSNEFDLDSVWEFLNEDTKNVIINQRKELDALAERSKHFSKKYRTDNQIEIIDGKWNLEWIPIIPDLIEELKINRNDNHKGNRFHKYFLFAIILEFNLSATDCQLTNEEFGIILGVNDINSIQNHLNDLMTSGYIEQHGVFGTYNSFHLHSAITKIYELMVSDSKLRKFVNKLLKSDSELLKSDSELLKSDSELYVEHTIEKIQEIIDEYKDNIGSDRNFKRTLICNIDKISDKNVFKIPIEHDLFKRMDTYSYLLLAIICNLTIINKDTNLKYTNEQYSKIIGCSERQIEKSINYLKSKNYIEAVYKGESNKKRDYIKLNKQYIE